MSTRLEHVVVVGAGAAGLTTVDTLRREGFPGRITVVGAEPHRPYDRPPLSKQILSGQWEPDRLALRPDEDFAALDAEWLLGTPAAALDVTGRKVTLADGRVLGYDGLVIATGVSPRRLPVGHDLDGVHVLHTVDDALALRTALGVGTRLVVVGAGFLGCETAAVASELGLEVTLVDPQLAPMTRQLGPDVAALIADLHIRHGVQLRTGTGVVGFAADGGRVTGVDLDDGTRQPADAVMVAIGSRPVTGWLADSGLSVGDGVDCDQDCQAAPGVVVAGDVANRLEPGTGRRVRVEHRMNATEQGTTAARSLLGRESRPPGVPYFWTDQYDAKVQVYGHPEPAARFTVDSGDPATNRFTAVYQRDGQIVAGLAWNSPREGRALRQRVLDGA
ncbi:FAD/NAD(P)-binding oxidoreductase [Amycolatopsis carbonis]|uniref:FAD/NAD(P)-binding oxidoreductase n=1 Tax=Amycolatopsis carbonis TaxID=715471 RepID=A0A9Y2ICR4_9PSEU|nr:FAD/NAD(P)-binding oxidoreductase [Amycolatopsis sp. 2-15]WIX76695.1 FAD/NAD(P)-binding oxidoreductase [Amycolatopsis sp. 2-15]